MYVRSRSIPISAKDKYGQRDRTCRNGGDGDLHYDERIKNLDYEAGINNILKYMVAINRFWAYHIEMRNNFVIEEEKKDV